MRTLEELTSRALWRMAWSERPLDLRPSPPPAVGPALARSLAAMTAGDALAAERLARAILEASRDHMIAAMVAQRLLPAEAAD